MTDREQQHAAFIAKSRRAQKPMVARLNLYDMSNRLDEMDEECDNIRWIGDTTGGVRQALAELIGDEDEANEYQTAFAILQDDISHMRNDLMMIFNGDEYDDDDPDLKAYDDFLVGIRAGQQSGGLMMGFDAYEGDYFGLGEFETDDAVRMARERLKRFTKDKLIEEAQKAFQIALQFLQVEQRYINLKGAIDLLENRYGGTLDVIEELNKLFETAMKEECPRYRDWYQFDRLTEQLPDQCWLE